MSTPKTSTYIKATQAVQPLVVANLSFDALLLEDNRYALTVSSVNSQLHISTDKQGVPLNKNASRNFKRILGKDWEPVSVYIQHFNDARYKGTPKQKAILVEDMEKLIQTLAIKGNVIAQRLLLGKEFKSKPVKEKPSCLYVIVDEPRGVCKIGISNNPQSRLKTIQTSYPFDLTIYFTKKVSDARELELKLHMLLDDFRLKGEWFDITCLNMIDWSSI